MAEPIVQEAPQNVAPVTSPSVERLNNTPEPSQKPLASLDDAFSAHFKNNPPKGEDGELKTQDEPKAEDGKPPTIEKKGDEKPKVDDPKTSKIVDPESIKPARELRSKEAQDGWNNLKENSKRIHEENKKLSTKIKDLETVVASKGGATQEEIKALRTQIDELKPYREMVDIQHDPDFRKSYDEPIGNARKAITKILSDLKTPQETIDLIDWNNPAQVDKVVAVMEEAGQKTLSRRILNHAEEIQKLSEKRQEALGNAKTKFSEFSKTREQKTLAQRTEEEAVINQVVQSAYGLKDEKGEVSLPFFQMKEIPANATQEQISQVEEHNKEAELRQSQVQAILKQTDPQDRALNAVRVVVGAVRDAQYRGAVERIQELEGEIKRISAAGSEKRGATPNAKPSNGSTGASTDEALESFFSSRKR